MAKKKRKAAKKSARKAVKKAASTVKAALKKRVRGATVSVTVKKKGSKKALKSCDRLSIGGGNVVEICTLPKKRKRSESAKSKSDRMIADREKAWAELGPMGAGSSSGLKRSKRRKSRKSR